MFPIFTNSNSKRSVGWVIFWLGYPINVPYTLLINGCNNPVILSGGDWNPERYHPKKLVPTKMGQETRSCESWHQVFVASIPKHLASPRHPSGWTRDASGFGGMMMFIFHDRLYFSWRSPSTNSLRSRMLEWKRNTHKNHFWNFGLGDGICSLNTRDPQHFSPGNWATEDTLLGFRVLNFQTHTLSSPKDW